METLPSRPTLRPLTLRQERFCHAFVNWAQGAVAAREAGYAAKSSRKQGSRLLATERIRARIHEIQTELARDAIGNAGDSTGGRDALIGKLEVVYRRAIEGHNFTAAARAVELQAKLSGMARPVPSVVPPPTPPVLIDAGQGPNIKTPVAVKM